MPGLSLGLGLSVAGPSTVGGGISGPQYIEPYDPSFVQLGDSRTDQSSSAPNNVQLLGVGLPVWLPRFTNNSIRIADPMVDFGIGSQNVENMCAIPRVSDATLGIDRIAALSAGIVVVLAGTNGLDRSVGGAARTAFTKMVDYLTNPSSTAYPGYSGLLYQGKAKNLIILSELPRGMQDDGTIQNEDATLATWAEWMKGFDYASGDLRANPRVIVVDTYNDPRLLDVASGAAKRNVRGILRDGLHQNLVGAATISRVVSERLATIPYFQTSRLQTPLPTAPTVANYVTPNPMLDVGAPGSSLVTPTGSGVPAGVSFINNGTLTVNCEKDGSTGDTIITVSSAGSATLDIKFVPTGGLNIGDKFRYTGRIGINSPVGPAGVRIKWDFVTSNGSRTFSFGDVDTDPAHGQLFSAPNANHAPLPVTTPVWDTAGMTGTVNYGLFQTALTITVGVTAGTVTLRLGPGGVAKV